MIEIDAWDIIREAEVNFQAHKLLLTNRRITETFLSGFDDLDPSFRDWVLTIRQTIHDRLLRALENAFRNGQIGDFARMELAEAVINLDPTHEEACRYLMRIRAASGNVAGALRIYKTLWDLLGDEYDMEPSANTEQLVAEIKAGRIEVVRQQLDRMPENGTSSRRMASAEPTSAMGPPIAVLPFQQISGDRLPNHLTEGLTADVICQLAGLRELSVISYGTTLGLRDRNLDLRSIGRMLGVRYVVRGSTRSMDDALRLTTELADADSGIVLWARSFDASRSMSFDDQDRIVALLVNALAPRVHEIELRRIRGKRPESLAIYEKVLLAREHLLMLGRENLVEARRLLDDVIGLEPAYAEGYALLSNWHSLMIGQGWSKDRHADILAVEQMARQSLALDGDNVRALVLYAHRRSLLHRDYQTAQELFDRALRIRPSSAFGWVWSSFTSSYLGDADEALRRASRAIELSPRDREAHIFLSAFCVANYTAGDYRAASEWGMKAIGERFALGSLYRYVSAALAACGQLQLAQEITSKGMKIMPDERVSDIIRNSAFSESERRQNFGAICWLRGFRRESDQSDHGGSSDLC